MAQRLAKARKRLTHDERREHLLDVTAELMLADGFEAVTMEAVKDRAGVSRGLAYTHFENAEELVFALYEREMTELERRLDALATSISAGKTFDERVRLATRTYFGFVVDRGGLLATLQLKLPQRWFKPSVLERLGRLLRHWSDEVEREFGVSPAFARALARSALAASEMLAAALRGKHLRARRCRASEHRVRHRRVAPRRESRGLMPFAERAGCRLFYELTGDPARPALVLVRGLARSSRHWAPLLPYLPGFRVLVLDNRGAGRSDAPMPPYSARELADDVAAVMDAAAIDRAHVFGSSLGGMIVQQLALAHAGRVDRLVIGCSTPGGERARAFPLGRRSARQWLALARGGGESVRVRGVIGQIAAALRHDVFDRLGDIAHPTLVVTGDDDAIISPANSELLAARIPNARLVVLPGLQHDFTADSPAGSARVIVDFLTEANPP